MEFPALYVLDWRLVHRVAASCPTPLVQQLFLSPISYIEVTIWRRFSLQRLHYMEVLLSRLPWKNLVSLFDTLLFCVLGDIIEFSEVNHLETCNSYAVQNADLCL